MAIDRFFGWFGVLLAAAFFTCAGCGDSGNKKARGLPAVTVAHPGVRSVQDVDEYSGWLEAFKTVEVRSRVRGHITKVCFQDGDVVKEGDPLFEIDPAPFEAELKQIEAQARALEAQRVAAQKDAERYRILLQSRAASQQEVDKAEADAESFNAQIAAKKAEADRRRLDLTYAKITAALSGRTSKANLVVGNLVNAGGSDPILTTIVAIDPIFVDFNVDERAIQRYQTAGGVDAEKEKNKNIPLRDRKIEFSFKLDTEQKFERTAFLSFADNKFAQGTGTALIRGEAKNKDGQLIPGSRVQVRIPVSDKYEAVIVPDTAVLSDQNRKYLLVLGKNNLVLRRDVSLGRLQDDGMRVIQPPENESPADAKNWLDTWKKEWLITLGLQRARENQPVQPLDADGKPVDTAAAQ